MSLPKPGEVIIRDFRPSGHADHSRADSQVPFRFLQWNIERGYKLNEVIELLKAEDADIIALQEIDIGCERSDCKDTGLLIAQALEMNYAFICEFEELKSDKRSPSSQGGGVHGNGILSRFDFAPSGVRVVEHTRHPIDWEREGEARFKEPRRGKRLTLAVTVCPPSHPSVLVYTAHLECFCGMLDRFWQISDIFKDASSQAETCRHQVIMGDLNTLGNGVARLGRNYCNDVMRWRSMGYFEAEVFDQCILQCKGDQEVNKWALSLGLPEEVCRHLVNRRGFEDPFDAKLDITLDHPTYRIGPFHLMTGKLDWCLFSGGFRVLSKRMGNEDFSASDHKMLIVEAKVD